MIEAEAKRSSRHIVFAVRDLPIEMFGGRHQRYAKRYAAYYRKFLLLTISTHANTDGSNCYPSVARLARETGTSVRATQEALAWLRDNSLLQIIPNGGPHRTNLFVIRIPETVHGYVHPERIRAPRTNYGQTVNADQSDGELQRSFNHTVPTNKRPSTTMFPVENARVQIQERIDAIDREAIRAEMEKWLGIDGGCIRLFSVDDEVLAKLICGCSEHDAHATSKDILHFIAEKGPCLTVRRQDAMGGWYAERKTEIRYPAMFLTEAVIRCFKGENSASRRRRRQLA